MNAAANLVPPNLRSLGKAKLSSIVVATARDPDGNQHVLSRIYDSTWNLKTFPWSPSTQSSLKTFRFDKLKHANLGSCVQEAIYARWRIGVAGYPPLKMKSVLLLYMHLMFLAQWLSDRNITSFTRITSKVALEYARWCRERPGRGGKGTAAPGAVRHRLSVLETLWAIRELVNDPLPEFPWPGESALSMAGALQRDQRKRKTEVIPEDIAAKLFNYAEQTVRQAENLISVWEGAEAIKAQAILEGRPRHIYDQLVSDYLEQMGVPPKLRINKTILEVRYACLFLIGLVTGMRIEEILSLKVGCFYTSEKDGDTFGWIRGRSTKTHIGDCEWMAPIDIVQTAVGVLERISAPLRDEATARAAALQRQLEDDKTPTETRITLLMELDQIRLHADHLFISHTHKKHNDVRLITTKTASARIAALPKQVGLKWRLHSHQFRATFAVFVSGHVLGDLRYLKKHYKHWSMDMTLLYAMNTKQDEELYEEIAKRYSEYTARVVDRWLDEKTKLSGGAAQRIIDYRRGGEVKTFKSRKEMVETLSDQIVLRSNGTSWCMADRSGCGGMGIIEKGRCVTCAEGTIEADIHAVAWRNIHVQQTELLQLQDIGPGGRQRVIRDLRIAEKVLTDLGLDFTPALISDEQGETSEDG